MVEYNYLISLIPGGSVNTDKLKKELLESLIVGSFDSICIHEDDDCLEILWEESLSPGDIILQSDIVRDHINDNSLDPKIWNFVHAIKKRTNTHDIKYNKECEPNLHPKRTTVQGEIRKVEWYEDAELTNKIVEVDIVYNRDGFGFAIDRTVTRKWIRNDGSFDPDFKVTNKKYYINSEDQIAEGKRRRGNIVNNIQLPTMAFMMETMMPPPTSMSQGHVLLTGRDFLDRHENYFQKFIENSSSITDFADPNFGRKTVVVAIEAAALTTDVWLKNKPGSLGGELSIADYLVGQFTI